MSPSIQNPTITAVAEAEIYKQYRLAEKIINEEYKIWKKTVPLVYDTVQTHVLKTPSLSIQWLPETTITEDKNSIIAKFLYGTHTSGTAQDYLKIGSVKVPATLSPDFQGPIPIRSSTGDNRDIKLQNVKSWKHKKELNKLKLSPNSKKVSTMGSDGSVYIYEIDSHEDSTPLELKYHTKEGYALEWANDNELLSGSGDNKIALWDITKKEHTTIISTHEAIVNDLSINKKHKFLVGSCSDDFSYQIHDLRSSTLPSKSAINEKPSDAIINCFQFHPEVETFFVTAGGDNLISLWDIRNPSTPLRRMYGHMDSITNLEFNPLNPTHLSSTGLDRFVLTWDLSLLSDDFNESQYYSKNDKTEYVDPMLIFKHGGHTNKINEFSYHPNLDDVVISCADDSLIEIWKQHFKQEEDDEDEDDEMNEEAED